MLAKQLRMVPDPSWDHSVHVALPCCLGTSHFVFQSVWGFKVSKPHSKLFTSKFFLWLLSTSSVACLNTPEAIWDHHQKPKFHCCPRWMWSHVSSHFSHLASGGQQTSTKASNLQNYMPHWHFVISWSKGDVPGWFQSFAWSSRRHQKHANFWLTDVDWKSSSYENDRLVHSNQTKWPNPTGTLGISPRTPNSGTPFP